jgi:predicted Zn finger-like uncharacterized protein
MATTTLCPECGVRLAIKPELLGKRVRCKKCGEVFVAEAGPAANDDSAGFQDRSSPPLAPPGRPAVPARRRRADEDLPYREPVRESPVGLIVGLSAAGLVLLAGAVVVIVLLIRSADRRAEPIASQPAKVPGPVLAQQPVAPGPKLWQRAGQGGWQQFTSPRGDFTASLPGNAQEIKRPVPAVAGAGQISVYLAVDRQTGLAYTLQSSDLPPAERNQILENNLPQFKAGMLSQLPPGSRILNEARVQVGGYPGMEFRIETPAPAGKVTSVARVAIVAGRIYSLSVAGQGITSQTPDVARFFSSFRITAK